MKTRPELVAPAGDWPSLLAAVESGADSVYFGVQGLNMRRLAENFDAGELPKVMGLLRERGKKGYLALNTVMLGPDLPKAKAVLTKAARSRVDAVILWDPAVMRLAKDLGLPFHISTQASVANGEAFAFYARQGARRIVLARECTLKDISAIVRFRTKAKDSCQIETFIHGAMCLSVSGRCFLSSYAHGKSANRGACRQPCRREYLIKEKDGDVEYVAGEDYVLSPKDLCTVDFIDRLMGSGIDAFKIEGRMRSAEYVRTVTAVYRQAIDAAGAGQLTAALKKDLRRRLETVYNRGFSDGFYFGSPAADPSRGFQQRYHKTLLGEVTRVFPRLRVAEIRLRHGGLRQGDRVLVIGKKTPALAATIDEIQQDHVFVTSAVKGQLAGVKLPFAVRVRDKVFLWKDREF